MKPIRAFARSAWCTLTMAARRQLHLSNAHRDWRLTFADASTGRVYRETISTAPHQGEPALLVVTFRLRAIGHQRLAHAVFRAESILNTPLFAGFPGFRSKLWLAGVNTDDYRGVYQWDCAELARSYATTLSALLRGVSVAGTVRFHVVPGVTPGAVLRDPSVLAAGDDPNERWWRITSVTAGPNVPVR